MTIEKSVNKSHQVQDLEIGKHVTTIRINRVYTVHLNLTLSSQNK